MYERFDNEARQTMQAAETQAKEARCDVVSLTHLLLAMVTQEAKAAAILRALKCNLDKLRELLAKTLLNESPHGDADHGLTHAIPLQRAVAFAIELAEGKDCLVGSSLLLLGLAQHDEDNSVLILKALGITRDQIRDAVLDQVPSTSKSKTPALDSFCRDLTALELQQKLDPMVGRQAELDRIIQILGRRTLNNPLLFGGSGVGKTAIIEGLAQRISSGNVPYYLCDKRLLLLDVGMMVAGTKYRGQFEERSKAVVNEARRSKNVLLFIDDLYGFAVAGVDTGSSAADLFRPALDRGEFQCIGAITPENFRKFSDQDTAFLRQFQQIQISPPSRAETIEIACALQARYESHHHSKITREAITAAVELSDLYLPLQHFPQKALNLIDDAGARQKLHLASFSPDVTALNDLILDLDAQKEAAVSDQDFEKASQLRDRAVELKKERESLVREWQQKQRENAGEVTEESILDALSRLTGIGLEMLRKRDTSLVPANPRTTVSAQSPFERLQCESILNGQDVKVTPGFGFVLIPHHEQGIGVYEAAIRPAMEENGLHPKIAGDIYEPGAILNQVWSCIRTAEVIIADVSEQNPNVIYELGLCFGLRRFPILLVQDPSALPFNLRVLRYIKYEDSVVGAKKLRIDLSAAIREFLSATRATG